MARRRGWVLAIEGAPGVGKSTVGAALAGALGARFLPEAFDRLRPPPDLRVPTRAALLATERRLLTEESHRFRLAIRWAAAGERVVADTGFFGPLTYSAALGAIDPLRDARAVVLRRAVALGARGALGPADVHVVLLADDRTLETRYASAPENHPPELGARHRAIARIERSVWRRLARSTLTGRVRFVRAERPVADVVQAVRRVTRRVRRAHRSSAVARRAIEDAGSRVTAGPIAISRARARM